MKELCPDFGLIGVDPTSVIDDPEASKALGSCPAQTAAAKKATSVASVPSFGIVSDTI